MPVTTQEKAPASAGRKHRGRGLRLLIVPPVLVLILILAAAVRPVQLGPVVTVDHLYLKRCGWRLYVGPSASASTTYLGEQPSTITARGHAGGLFLGDSLYGIAWFYGQRKS